MRPKKVAAREQCRVQRDTGDEHMVRPHQEAQRPRLAILREPIRLETKDPLVRDV